jgi:hypothetical protein
MEAEAEAEPIAIDYMTDEELQAVAQGKYQPGRKYVYDHVFEVVETVVTRPELVPPS